MMNLKDIDQFKTSKLITQLIENVTCDACCKYYMAPQTASCGHSLCHTCWRGHQKCVICDKPVERQSLRCCGPIQDCTEDTHALADAYTKIFKVNVAEFLMDVESENDSTKNVRDWLASSQNHFSGPPRSSGKSSQELVAPTPLNQSSNKVQVHTHTAKAKSPEKVVYVPTIPQDDWDKIEQMPNTEDTRKDKENIVGPMDIEPFYIDENNEYTVTNPRRSSRKKELKLDKKHKNVSVKSLEKSNSKDSSEEIDKKSNKAKQHWMNVKKMKKEFSKLNKNRNKLNVSIEMCKKTQNTAKTVDVVQVSKQIANLNYEIDENTPDLLNKETTTNDGLKVSSKNSKLSDYVMNDINSNINEENKTQSNQMTKNDNNNSAIKNNDINDININTFSPNHGSTISKDRNIVKLPFYKKSALHPNYSQNPIEITTPKKTTHNVTVDSNATANDDIEITIKVANTVTNIVIKRKNDMKLKVNTDRQIQTSLDPQDLNTKANSSKSVQSQNILINVDENNEIQLNHHPIINTRLEELKKVPTSEKTESEKKNTDSADTATAQFEITESVEKELSKVMDIQDNDTQSKSTSNHPKIESFKDGKFQKSRAQPSGQEKSQGNQNSQIPTNPPDLEYLNDLDIFDSESVKESDVRLLKHTEHAASEILLCTVKTKNRTQKAAEKRRNSNEDLLPSSKKAKVNDDESKQIEGDSESMNYDAIMGTVFANIDAEMEENHQTQNIIKNTYNLADNNIESQVINCTTIQKSKETQEALLEEINNQKDSENIFSIGMEKGSEKIEVAESLLIKVPPNVLQSNMEDFLTPVTSQAANNDQMNDDSDRSVVEETPQKTSFTKGKQKSIGPLKEANLTQRMIESPIDRVSSKNKITEQTNDNSVVNLTDTSDMRSDVNLTAVKAADRKATETPLTINKFVDQIQHNSTPLAKKSLNFDTEMDDLTICTTNEVVAKTTQEREFMNKAFEKTPVTPAVRQQSLRNLALKHKKLIIAGSCLKSSEIGNLKKLCARYKWTYVDKYTKDLTHLVVGVDEENKAQRSVKYMCALASSLWIISYAWVEKSLQSKDLVYEEPYEVLDSTGHPGPRRSRIAGKLFQGITFFCMEPFSVLDVDTLKDMILSAGGRVVAAVSEVRVTAETTAPAILLAEPENTQEDRFVYLSLELSIVPVNFEWVLNCLGSYTLTSILELLLCPVATLPKPVQKWPQELLQREDDDE